MSNLHKINESLKEIQSTLALGLGAIRSDLTKIHKLLAEKDNDCLPVSRIPGGRGGRKDG